MPARLLWRKRASSDSTRMHACAAHRAAVTRCALRGLAAGETARTGAHRA